MLRWIVEACLLTISIWFLAGLAMLGPILGDCAPDVGWACPSDQERDAVISRIVAGTALLNAGAIGLLIYAHRKRQY
jgi:hypothetical protein